MISFYLYNFNKTCPFASYAIISLLLLLSSSGNLGSFTAILKAPMHGCICEVANSLLLACHSTC